MTSLFRTPHFLLLALAVACLGAVPIQAKELYWVFIEETRIEPPEDSLLRPYFQTVFVRFSNIMRTSFDNTNGNTKEAYRFFRDAPDRDTSDFHLSVENPKLRCSSREFRTLQEAVDFVKKFRYVKLTARNGENRSAVEDGRYAIVEGLGQRSYFSHNSDSREIDLASKL